MLTVYDDSVKVIFFFLHVSLTMGWSSVWLAAESLGNVFAVSKVGLEEMYGERR